MNSRILEYRMFSLVMYNISTMQKGIQTTHAALEYANKFGDTKEFKLFVNCDKTLIILDGGTSGDMWQLLEEINQQKINATGFIETDLNDALSSIVFIADERVWDRENYPNFKDFYDKKLFERLEPLKQEDVYDEWVELLGGESNVYLREVINSKRLAS